MSDREIQKLIAWAEEVGIDVRLRERTNSIDPDVYELRLYDSELLAFAELVRQDERMLSLELAGVLRELLELEDQGRHADDISIEVWERAQRAFYGWKGGE